MNKAGLTSYQRSFFEEVKYLKPGNLMKMLKRFLQPGRGYHEGHKYEEELVVVYSLCREHFPGYRSTMAEKIIADWRKRRRMIKC
jgi:hypothetical protein